MTVTDSRYPMRDLRGLTAFNDAGYEQARDCLLACCAAPRWAEHVVAGRPYASPDALIAAAERAFDALTREQWLEAFAAHARIGEPRKGDRRGAAEQAGARDADVATRAALERGNQAYEARFGHVFLVCANGLSASEMLGALEQRIAHTPEREFAIATDEQRRIAGLRLREVVLGA